jgi:hypothetical protein
MVIDRTTAFEATADQCGFPTLWLLLPRGTSLCCIDRVTVKLALTSPTVDIGDAVTECTRADAADSGRPHRRAVCEALTDHRGRDVAGRPRKRYRSAGRHDRAAQRRMRPARRGVEASLLVLKAMPRPAGPQRLFFAMAVKFGRIEADDANALGVIANRVGIHDRHSLLLTFQVLLSTRRSQARR